MQTPHIKLKEIIWEITSECHNGCKYCGSKLVRNEKTSVEDIYEIAKAIAKYPPEQIDISGGDPLILSISTHEEVLRILREKNIICKILVNPKSIGDSSNSAAFEILEKYDWTGISINTKEELSIAKKALEVPDGFHKYTVITNFNIQNLYNFDLIEEFVKTQDKMWTIQFTVYDDPNNPLALYNTENEDAFNLLKEKVENSDANIILSDNIRNDSTCSAGHYSIGITSVGYVIPCLSMRSWASIDLFSSRNLFKIPLEEIWKNEFKEQRFGCFKCCKDACGNKFLQQKSIKYKSKDEDVPTIKENINLGKLNDFIEKTIKEIKYPKRKDMTTIMYGVAYPSYPPIDLNPPIVMMYGVFNQNSETT